MMSSPKNKSQLAEQICSAIANKHRVQFEYHDKLRMGEPQACGVNSKGNEVARFYLLHGGSRPEQLFLLSEIKSFRILDEHFSKPGPNYSKDDKAMDVQIYCQL
jgi:hypothetical protein